ncbi:unnamed protein product [Closterium sp. NIES-65]|nr:unnamed protein product [Closterium sp. NIES-65]
MEEVEETNYRAGNGLTRRVQGVGEELEGVTLPSPFAAEMTEAEADALVNNHRALYQQALKRRETIASSVGKTKCVHTLSGVPVPQKKSRAAKSGGQKGKRRRKAGATTGTQADLPAHASTEEELVTDGLPDLPLPASSQQQQQTVKALDTFTWLITDAPVECMEFFPTFEVFQPHLITKYQLCGVNRDEYFYATGGRIEFEKLVMKVIKTKHSNTHKKVRFYAWGAGGLVDESKWPLLAVEQIIPSKKRTEEKWLEEFRHGIPFANIAFEKAALAAFSVVTSSLVYVKIPMVAYLCVVVEAPLESYRPGNGQPSLGGVPLTSSNLVRAKTTVVLAALHAAMVNNPTFLKHDEPKGLVLGSGKVRILIEGWERVFL